MLLFANFNNKGRATKENVDNVNVSVNASTKCVSHFVAAVLLMESLSLLSFIAKDDDEGTQGQGEEGER